MFENLVESTSHKEDISRKGSFILVTSAVYAILGVAFFVGGIYWYDARLSELELELTTLVAPVPVPQQAKEPEKKEDAKPAKTEPNVDVRRELIASVDRTELVPKEVSAKASDVPPVRRGVTTVVGTADTNTAAPISAGSGTGTVVGVPTKVDVGDAP
ncbi:MAG TPA: hypothetical protein VI750_08285, partial [Pyrinomonadaceae bacterium]|nr:hypothetical protein [Pyrinomonadaceae bacterium]